MAKLLRVLFAIHSPPDPATAVFLNVTRRAESLRAVGHTSDIVTPADVGVRAMHGIWPLLFPVVLVARARLFRYDAIVFHSYAGWAFLALRWLAGRQCRITTVTMFHGLEPLFHDAEERELAAVGRGYRLPFRVLHRVVIDRLLRMSCRLSDAVFCLNQRERDFLVERRWCAPDRVAIVGNGVEAELFVPRAFSNREAVRLLFVAQWILRKGIRYLVRAFTKLAEERPGLSLVCAGTGAAAPEVLAAFPPHVRNRVTVLPRVNRSELANLLAGADVFVFPSLFEGFSGALLEAMAAGLPVVATPAGAAADMLQDGSNGLIVPCSDDRALALAVRRLLDDSTLRARVGEAGRDLARLCEWTEVNTPFIEALLEVVHTGKAAGDRRPFATRHVTH